MFRARINNLVMYISDQQVVREIQTGLEMGTVMILQTMKGVSLMVVIAADQMSLHPIAQNVCAVTVGAVNPICAIQMKTVMGMDFAKVNIVLACPTTTYFRIAHIMDVST